MAELPISGRLGLAGLGRFGLGHVPITAVTARTSFELNNFALFAPVALTSFDLGLAVPSQLAARTSFSLTLSQLLKGNLDAEIIPQVVTGIVSPTMPAAYITNATVSTTYASPDQTKQQNAQVPTNKMSS